MATMPPVELGVILAVAYILVVLAHGPLERRWVESRPNLFVRGRSQFWLGLALWMAAGVLAAAYNTFVLGYPPTSAISLLVGCATLGFFASLDLSLQRERIEILAALEDSAAHRLPRRLYPMTRRFSLIAVVTVVLVAGIMSMVISRDIVWLSKIQSDAASLKQAQLSVIYEVAFMMAVFLLLVVNLILSYARNLKLLFENETDVLEKVSQGDLSGQVPVATNDEFGVIAGHTNAMIDGLRHRMEMMTALKVAEEVQQNFLPQAPPRHPHLDIAGVSQYCDETGGDYFDYLSLPDDSLAVIVADASGHGIGAALFMSTARAFLLAGIHPYQGPAHLLSEVNRKLLKDSGESGRFITLFFLEMDSNNHVLQWVRAGHEPALLYDPVTEQFQHLNGRGVALGVFEPVVLEQCRLDAWPKESIIVVGTDGIRESRNAAGEMFGDERLQQVIHAHRTGSAEEICRAVTQRLEKFRQGTPLQDDVTLVVVKRL